jgi:hypothetical protein
MKYSKILKIPVLATAILAATFSPAHGKWMGRENLADHISKYAVPIRNSEILKEYLIMIPTFEYKGENVKADVRLIDWEHHGGFIKSPRDFKAKEKREGLGDALIIRLYNGDGTLKKQYNTYDLIDHQGGESDLVDKINRILGVNIN